jgi:beta-glucanase (GH16 family)
MTPAPEIPGYTILWSDNFSGAAGTLPNTSTNWDIVSAGPNFGNHEVQTYTTSPSNVSLSGQNTLQITPFKDTSGNWTSARLESKPYFACPAGGKMILQASLQTGTSPQPNQTGIWPAFWALGASVRSGTSWPECGEWDIMENAHGVSWTLASLHYGPDGNQANEKTVGGGVGSNAQHSFPAGQFNTFTLTVDRTATTWQDETLTWSLNGTSWFTVKGSAVNDETLWANCAQKAYYAILNVAVGSNFPDVGGQPDGLTVSGLGGGMQVQYVAFYQSTAIGGKKEVEGVGEGGASQKPMEQEATKQQVG